MSNRILQAINFDPKGEVMSVLFYGDPDPVLVKNFKPIAKYPKTFNDDDQLTYVEPIVVLTFKIGGYEMMCVKLKNCSYAC